MTTITIEGKPYAVPDEVKKHMQQLRWERDWNYMVAQNLDKRLREAMGAIKVIKGVTSMKRYVPIKQRGLFK